MMIHKWIVAALLTLFWMSALPPGYAQVRLPSLVRDSMVIQRDTRLKIWGWAAKGEKVTIGFNGKKFRTATGNDGKWSVWLSPMSAGGPYTMLITARNTITLKDILVGDVWICSGQSNMVHNMQLHSVRYAEDIAKADYPEIRHFFIPTVTDLQAPLDDLPAGYWRPASSPDILQFSAVAYFFAKTIYKKYHVPIGLINASVGGPPIEAWISEEGLKAFPELLNTVSKNKDRAYVDSVNKRAAGDKANLPRPQQDKGMAGPRPWYDTSYIPKGWRNINVPGYWDDQGIRHLNGVVWYRKEIDVPLTMTGIPAKIFLGRIVDADFLYVNGVLVGNTTYQYPQRRYPLPAGLLKPGKNTIVIRVINDAGRGGFVPDKPYYLSAGGQDLDLKGYWQYKVGQVYAPHGRPAVRGISAQDQPTALFNAMIAPLINYGIKGILWYQGEANTGRAAEYAKLLPALISDWRSRWQQGDVPFLYVQLPNFMEMNYQPSESQWAELREAQLRTLSVPNTGMAVAIDLGEWNELHPDNKKDVGIRLALAAEKVAYGEKDVVYSGPLYRSFQTDGNKMIISFTNTGSGLISNDGEELSQFAIAGADKKFVWARAKIDGGNVVVWNDEISHPKYVRYAWADNPDGANLYNREGLPASPFQAGE